MILSRLYNVVRYVYWKDTISAFIVASYLMNIPAHMTDPLFIRA